MAFKLPKLGRGERSVVYIDDRVLARSLQSGTGGVGRWRNKTTKLIVAECIATAPVNEVGSALHRGGVVGTYKRSFHSDKRGSRRFIYLGRVTNTADHAKYVEHGRSSSGKRQKFSWAAAPQYGVTWWVPYLLEETKARKGQHIMKHAAEKVALSRRAVFLDHGVL